MALLDKYNAGTISVAQNSTTVTGTGTAWLPATVKAGDTLYAGRALGLIETIDSATSLTLALPWKGGAVNGGAYAIHRTGAEWGTGERRTLSTQLAEAVDRISRHGVKYTVTNTRELTAALGKDGDFAHIEGATRLYVKRAGRWEEFGDLGGIDRDAVLAILAAGKAGDSDKLDGKDSREFAATNHNHDTDYAKKDGSNIDGDKWDGNPPGTGGSNTRFGQNALSLNTTGSRNTASGVSALANNTTGSRNTASGYQTLSRNTTGNSNTAGGQNALSLNTTGSDNTACGQNALFGNTTGYRNTASGVNALSGNTTGSYRGGFGYNAQAATDYSIQIGSDTQVDSRTIQVHASSAISVRSDARDKTDIADSPLGLAFINALHPKQYRLDKRDFYQPEPPTLETPERREGESDEDYEARVSAARAAHQAAFEKWQADRRTWWSDPTKAVGDFPAKDGSKKADRLHVGFIAQDVKAAVEATGTDYAIHQHSAHFNTPDNANGDDSYFLVYEELIAPLVKAVQELSTENDALKQRLEALEAA